MDNPSGYLTLLPPINGANAVSGSPYFTENFGQPFKMWDTTITYNYMPKAGAPGGLKRGIVTRISPIGPAIMGSRLRAETRDLRRNTFARTALLPRRYRAPTPRHRRDSLLRETASLWITPAAPLHPRVPQPMAAAGRPGYRTWSKTNGWLTWALWSDSDVHGTTRGRFGGPDFSRRLWFPNVLFMPFSRRVFRLKQTKAG